MDDLIDPELIDVSVSIRRPPDGGVDVLRQFEAVITYCSEDDEVEIGSVRGWIGWRIDEEDLYEAADAISSDSEALGSTAVEIIQENPDAWIDDVVLIDRMHLEPEWRGHRLSGAVIDELLALLRLDPESTVVVLQPEPQRPAGGPYRRGAQRDGAMAKLTSAYRKSGLLPWREGPVWWRPLGPS